MSPYLTGIIEYLVIGLAVLAIFDLITKRIHSRFSARVFVLQEQTGFGYKTCVVLIVFGLIGLWPAVILGAILNYNGGKSES